MEMVSGIRRLAANYRYRNMAAPKYEKGSRWFLGQHPVVVVRCYEVFQLVRIRYEDEDKCFCVDEKALSAEPDDTKTISLALLNGTVRSERGDNDDQ